LQLLSRAILLLCTIAAGAAAQPPSDGWFTASDGVKLHYLELGQGSPVILIHGYGGDARYRWFDSGVAQHLARNHRVLALDCRGHGKSDKPRDPNAYGPRMAGDVVALMDHLGIARAHVHGYSMGGGIVTELLDRQPDRIVTASYGGSGVPEVDPAWIAKLPPDRDEKAPGEERALRPLEKNPDHDEEALRALREYPWKPGERDRIDLARVKAPVLAINGAFDKPNQKITRMKRELETFWSYVLPDRGHLTTVGPEYTKILASFLDLYDPGTPPPEHRWFTASDGVKLHYWALGSAGAEKSGKPVVLLHGFSGSADMWLMNGVAAALRGRHRVLALDCRGHGLSDKPHDPTKYGLQIADDVAELLDHERVATAHVHGFSLGGWILAQLLTRHPERLATAAFVGHGVLELDPELLAMVPADYPGIDTSDPRAREAARAPIEIEARKVKGPGARDEEALAAARAYPWKPGEKGEGEIFPSRLPIDLTAVKIPVLALMGEHDFPNMKSHRLWRELADFQMVRLPERGHTSAVAPGYISPAYVPATVRFIDANDARGETNTAAPPASTATSGTSAN
jgi:pimeloyl-ACP methyl ester carboxylesterase